MLGFPTARQDIWLQVMIAMAGKAVQTIIMVLFGNLLRVLGAEAYYRHATNLNLWHVVNKVLLRSVRDREAIPRIKEYV